jgi:hypothetical protein
MTSASSSSRPWSLRGSSSPDHSPSGPRLGLLAVAVALHSCMRFCCVVQLCRRSTRARPQPARPHVLLGAHVAETRLTFHALLIRLQSLLSPTHLTPPPPTTLAISAPTPLSSQDCCFFKFITFIFLRHCTTAKLSAETRVGSGPARSAHRSPCGRRSLPRAPRMSPVRSVTEF